MKKLKRLNDIAREMACNNGAKTEDEIKEVMRELTIIEVVEYAKRNNLRDNK